jgi:hypothetical protein
MGQHCEVVRLAASQARWRRTVRSGVFPTDEEKRRRSPTTLGAMLITGNLTLVCTSTS